MSETDKLKERMTAPDWDVWLAIASNVLGRLADAKDARRARGRAATAQPAAETATDAGKSWWRSLLPDVRAEVTPERARAARKGNGTVRAVRWGLWGVALAGAGAAGFGLRGAGRPGWSWRDGLRGPVTAGLGAAGLAVASLAALDRWRIGRR